MTHAPPRDRLDAFETYADFVQFCNEHFDVSEDEIAGLYQVMLKLQSIGEDPVRTMLQWKEHTCEHDCSDFIRFMIMVDRMEMADLKTAVES